MTRATMAEAAMNAARDTTMARDAERFDALRDRWARPAQPQGPGPDSTGIDAFPFEAAERSQRASHEGGPTSSSTPRTGDLSGAHTLLAAAPSAGEPNGFAQPPSSPVAAEYARPVSPVSLSVLSPSS
ncbi:hypothetical protein [Streptomyces sp. NPDC005209]|uniref:hypothetical protein n=1 Tax=Streptomyces sp. NPDC005209 TaxID=3156715 RepID=UPI0033AC2939